MKAVYKLIHCKIYNLSQINLLVLISLFSFSKKIFADSFVEDSYSKEKCVQIYFDEVPDAEEKSPHAFFGKIHAMYLQNLLGHFPEYQQYVIPIEKYRKGDLDRCKASVYLGTYFDNNIPDSFIDDYLNTKKNVLWAGYNIWKLTNDKLYDLWKVTYGRLTGLDNLHLDSKSHPGFYKYYSYKEEVFVKHASWHKKDANRFMAAYEVVDFDYKFEEVEPYVLSWAMHSTTNSETPYILRNKNHFYIGDSPFSFITVEDRYLIVADLLFDILDEKPRHTGKKPALFRIEDIHPTQPLWQLYRLTDLLYSKGVPYSVALIAVFSDPFGTLSEREHTFVPLTAYTPFLDFLDKVKKEHDASFIFHGVTHQLASCRNPYNAMSGDDFEFWDIVNNRPIPQDAPDWVIKRVQDGHSLLREAGVQIEAWESPHYQASPLDYFLFGQVFSWNIGRVTYFPSVTSYWSRLSETKAINISGEKDNQLRLNQFKNFAVSYPDHLLPSGQFYPYEIFGDIYDQRLIPENVGNFEPFYGIQAPAPRTVDDLIKVAKRNSVLRDVWASLFMHAHLLEATWQEGLGKYPGDVSEMDRFVDEIRAAGYEFISLKKFTKNNMLPKRNPSIHY